MIEQILLLLRHAPLHKSELIDTAKGKYKYPENFKELIKTLQWQYKK